MSQDDSGDLKPGTIVDGDVVTFGSEMNGLPAGTEFVCSDVVEDENGIRAFRITPKTGRPGASGTKICSAARL